MKKPKTQTMTMFLNCADQWQWRLQAHNGNIISGSLEGYQKWQKCWNGWVATRHTQETKQNYCLQVEEPRFPLQAKKATYVRSGLRRKGMLVTEAKKS